MAARIAPLTESVRQCVPRTDGGYWIITKKSHAVSPTAIPEGAAVVIRDGQAVRAAR
jgi:hypothetical protein